MRLSTNRGTVSFSSRIALITSPTAISRKPLLANYPIFGVEMLPTLRITSSTRHLILYGISLALLLFVLKWLEFHYFVVDISMEVYIGAIAVIFTALGIWLTLKLTKPKIKTETIIVEKEVFIHQPAQPANTPFSLNEKQLEKHNISARELEVLQLMATGMSNQEIADTLYVSQNTIKTHSSNLFLKLDVNRRTQAVDKGRKIGLIP